MQILVIDASSSIDSSVLQTLSTRGYAVTICPAASEVLDLIRRTEFDCILIDVRSAGDCLGLSEIRQLAGTSAVALVATMPVESMVAEAIAEGSIEFQSLSVLIAHIEYIIQPVLLVGTGHHPSFMQSLMDKGLRVSTASTLQFAMNLLVDGWCQIVWLQADIPGGSGPGKLAIVHRVTAKELAILASNSSRTPAGIITRCRKPQTAGEFITFVEDVVGNRLAACGLTDTLVREHRGKH